MEWEPGKYWTHPSVMKLTDDELRAKYVEAITRLEEDEIEFKCDPREDAKELLRLDRQLADTFFTAMASRGLV